MNLVLRFLAFPPLALLLVACAEQRPVPPLDLARAPPLAAEFRTTIESARGDSASTEWRFWRAQDRIERENPAARSGDLWVRDGRTLFHTRLYHGDRKGIEYRSEDLQILNAAPEWAALSTLLDPDLIAALPERETGWREGYPYRRYSGEVAAIEWDITVRTDLMLPVHIEQRGVARQAEIVELLRTYETGKAPWAPPAGADYDILDYSDLGDRERDPFVMRIQAEEGGGHLHGHAH